jgi:hypothetical protein
LHARDLTFRGLFSQLTQAVTNIDGRLIRTFRYLIRRPGTLTMAFMNGQRKPFVGPVQLFLIANVLFFTTESLTGGKVFTTPLASHIRTQPWNEYAAQLVAHRLQTKNLTLDLYEPIFDKAMALNARSLIIFMALSFAPVLIAVFPRNRHPVVVHPVFSLHLYAFLLLLLCVATAIPPVERLFGGAGFDSETLDHAIAIGILISCAAYLFFATRPVYGARGAIRLLQVATLTVGVAGIILGYRFLLLLITLYTT